MNPFNRFDLDYDLITNEKITSKTRAKMNTTVNYWNCLLTINRKAAFRQLDLDNALINCFE